MAAGFAALGVEKGARGAVGPGDEPGTRGGRQSRHRRFSGSTSICLLLNNAPNWPQLEQGSAATLGLGRFGSGMAAVTAGVPRATFRTACAVRSALWLGMHSKHFRFGGSNFICRLL